MQTSNRSLVSGLVATVSLLAGCSGSGAASAEHETVTSANAALVAGAPQLLVGFGGRREGYVPAAVVCDSATAIYGVRFTGDAPVESSEGFPAGVAAELLVWDRASAPTRIAGATTRSGRGSLSFAFAEAVDGDAGPSTTYSVVRNNVLSDTRTVYSAIVGKKTGAQREAAVCRNVERVAFACLTEHQSVYVTRTVEGGYHYASYDAGATAPSRELDGGKLVGAKAGERARLVFESGDDRYVLKISPYDAQKAFGEVVTKHGDCTVAERCAVLLQGQGSPGVDDVNGDVGEAP